MDKLPKNIRRPNGDLVAHKRPHGPRLLLPAEVELCKVLGLNEEEYWYFVDLTAGYNGQRPKGYELIPDIQAGTVLGITIGKAFLVNLGIAVAAATVSYLLTPKPKEQKQGGSRRTADSIGNSRFAPQASFNSIQELAVIGDSIPLIFCNQQEENDPLGTGTKIYYGGIRVNSQLLWSQFVSLGKYQQLKALCLFSLGVLDGGPEYAGFAVGDSLLNTYNSHKVGLYFRNGVSYTNNYGYQSNRIKESDRYTSSELTFSGTDPFEVGIPAENGGNFKRSSKAFSSARNPSVQTVFGTYSCFPNCQVCRLPYELVSSVRGTSKEAGWDNARKRKKLQYAHWPVRCGIVAVYRGSTPQSKGKFYARVNDIIVYQIVGLESGVGNALQRVYDTDPSQEGYQEEDARNKGGHNYDAFGYKPHGVDDVDSMTTAIRERADSGFAVGELYLIGNAVAKCVGIDSPRAWGIEDSKAFTLTVVEDGYIDIPAVPSTEGLGPHCDNPRWYAAGGSLDVTPEYSLSDTTPILYRQIMDGVLSYGYGTRDIYKGDDIYAGLKVAFATVSNNRNCDATEIGIKSKVFKRMQFANLNSQPDQEALDRAYNDRTHIQLGQVNRYLPRLSFFMLQVRKIGGTTWNNMINSSVFNHTGLFAIRGNTPEYLYNYITILQEDSNGQPAQFEYRFKPYPGNYIVRENQFGKRVNLLDTSSEGKANTSTQNFFRYKLSGVGDFNVLFSGDENYELTKDSKELNNPEWMIEKSTITLKGAVTRVVSTQTNTSSWSQQGGVFNGAGSTFSWQPVPGLQNVCGTKIAYWDRITLPAHVGGDDYHWVYYPPGYPANPEIKASQNPGGGGNPRGKQNWPFVYILHPNNSNYRYVPTPDPSSADHISCVNHQRRVETQNELIYFEGSVPAYHDDDDYYTNGNGIHFNVKVERHLHNGNYYWKASFSIDPDNRGDGYRDRDIVFIPKQGTGGINQGEHATIGLPQMIQVRLTVGETTLDIPAQNFNRNDVIKDWNEYEGDINSNKDQPEHEICFVNEIILPKSSTGEAKYNDLAYAGLRINSSKEWTTFSQFSAYFKKGIKINRLIDGGTGASNLFPEIAHALLTSSEIGAGELVGPNAVSESDMTESARFCRANKFFWDGTISSKLNLRDFIFEHAGYCLLDFTIIGGKFSLKPSVPYSSTTYLIDKTQPPAIKALFTDGNINDLQVSFLSPEERQSFKAAVMYRQETPNGFPETKSILVRSTDTKYSSDNDPIETFDMSGFCTSLLQAKTFAQFAIKTRILSDHGLSFKTAPQFVQTLSPGEYFRLVSEVTHVNRFNNGVITPDGTVVWAKEGGFVGPSQNKVYVWEPGTENVVATEIDFDSTSSVNRHKGKMFTVRSTTEENKVYKCETISYAEDGLIEVSGSYAPTETNGTLSVLQNWDSTFDIKGD
jgi:hypothetical protein